MRSDNLTTTLGERGPHSRRLWIEDAHFRLSRNGFERGTAFVADRRGGLGMNLRPALLGSRHVSHRRNSAILSLESPELAEAFPVNDLRVKISVGLVQLLPSVRAFSVRKSTSEVWSIEGNLLTTPEGTLVLRDGLERPRGRPATICLTLSEENVVEATSLIAWAKPGRVEIRAAAPFGQLGLFDTVATSDPTAEVLTEVARQFLTGAGWEETMTGEFRR